MIGDFHTHTRFSGDSKTDPDLLIERAVALGMDTIAITDHMDTDCQDKAFVLDTEAYLPFMEELRWRYRDRIKIRIGVELGMQPHLAKRHKEYVEAWPFDFVIASQHLVGGIDPYYPEAFAGKEDGQVFEAYFMEVLDNLKAMEKEKASYSVLGHIDYVVRYGRKKEQEYSYKKYGDLIDEILKIVIENGKGIEVNTGGLYKGLPFPNPHFDIIRRYREIGGEIVTLGSDAHDPTWLGHEFAAIRDYLDDCNYRFLTDFKGLTPAFYPLK